MRNHGRDTCGVRTHDSKVARQTSYPLAQVEWRANGYSVCLATCGHGFEHHRGHTMFPHVTPVLVVFQEE